MTAQDAGQHLKLRYIPAFDGLRGTVLTVLFAHLENMCPILADHRTLKLLLYNRTWYTLNIFFCLSGFLITWLLVSEMQTTGKLDLIRFYKRRTVRLLPAYLTAIVAAVILASYWGFSSKQILHDSAYFFTYTYNLFVSTRGTNFAPALAFFLLPAWSLCVEEQFYFVWSAALKWVKLKNALAIVVWSLIVLSVYRCALIFEMRQAGFTVSEIFSRFYFGTDTRIHAILFGCAAALALHNRRYYDLARKYLKAKFLPFLLPVVITAIVFLTARQGEPSLQYQLYGAVISLTLLSAWIVCLMFQPDSPVTRFLGSRPLRLLGRISYGTYIFHYLVIRIVVRAFDISNAPYNIYRNLAAWIVAATVTILVAMVHYYLIEVPLQSKYKSAVKVPARLEHPHRPAPAYQTQIQAVKVSRLTRTEEV